MEKNSVKLICQESFSKVETRSLSHLVVPPEHTKAWIHCIELTPSTVLLQLDLLLPLFVCDVLLCFRFLSPTGHFFKFVAGAVVATGPRW